MASKLLFSAALLITGNAQGDPTGVSSCVDYDTQLRNLLRAVNASSTITNCVDAVNQNAAICDSNQIYDVCCATCCPLADVYADSDLQYWDETYIAYDSNDPIVPDSCGYAYGDPNRKHLHMALPLNKSLAVPAPVLFWAHGNGGLASTGITSFLRPGVKGTNYAIVGWESITALSPNASDTFQCQADFELVMDWVVEHGNEYNLSTTDWIVGGRSRGSICSWVAANGNRSSGMYLYGALPLEEEDNWSNGVLVNTVTVDSPPAYFAYGPCCPKPIIYEGEDKCDIGGDIHNPRNGQRIVDRYTELGMADDITLTDCMVDRGEQPLHYFAEFVESINEDPTTSPTSLPTSSPIATTGTPSASPTAIDDSGSNVIYAHFNFVFCCFVFMIIL